MRCTLLALGLVPLLISGCACDRKSKAPPAPAPPRATSPEVPAGHVAIDGSVTKVRWDDGDTFSWKGADGKKVRARLSQFNTLESYGPVHRWGEWTPEELLEVANLATKVASERGWKCDRTGRGGGYGRVGVRCHELSLHLIGEGLAHAFAVKGSVDGALLEAQAAAQKARRGMWAKGVPKGLVTSLHSADEGRDTTYDRVADTATGEATPQDHDLVYKQCQEVCRDGSCMRYIPYPRRYGKDRLICPK